MAMTRANQKSSIGSLKYHIKSFRFVCGKGSPAPKKIVTTMTLDDESLYEQETNLTPLHMLDENGLALESFPQWDAIRSNDLPVDLKSYWNVDQQIVAGDVLDVAGFSEQFLTQ